MKRLLTGALVVLASCATAPMPPATSPVADPTPAAVVAPAPLVQTIEVALPASVRSFYPNGDPSGVVTFRYNDQGLLVLQESFSGNGVLFETRSGKARGEFWRITVANAQGEVTSFEDLKTGSLGEVLTQTFLGAKEAPQATNEYTYDQAGRKVLWTAKSGAGALQARTVYTYDTRGNNTRTEVYDSVGGLTNVFVSTYDGSHLTSRQGFDAAKNLVEQTNFTWSGDRKVKEETVKPLLRTTEYLYGDKTAPTGLVISVRGKVVERQSLEYRWFTKTVTP